MLTRILLAVLNGIIVYVLLFLLVVLLGMIGFNAEVLTRFIWVIAVLVGILTFLGAVPNYWNKWVR